MLDLVEDLTLDVGDRLQPSVSAGVGCDRNQAIVSQRFTLLSLFSFNHPKKARRD